MHDRIKELEQECYEDRSHGYGSPYFNREKFAELIVQECANVIQQKVSLVFKEGEDPSEFSCGRYAGSLEARVMLKEHFGIK